MPIAKLEEIPAETALAINKAEKPEKQLAQYIQKKLKGGQVVVDYWVGVMEDTKQRQADRLKASELLANRAWGKPKEVIQVEAGGDGLEALSLETLLAMAAAWKGDVVEGEFVVLDATERFDIEEGQS